MMPPKKSNRKNNNPPRPPPPQYDPAKFQATVTAVVAAAMSRINTSDTSGAGSSANPSNHGDSQGQPRECFYKDFMNAKSKSFDGTGGIVALTRWFEKTKSIFKIVCATSLLK